MRLMALALYLASGLLAFLAAVMNDNERPLELVISVGVISLMVLLLAEVVRSKTKEDDWWRNEEDIDGK